MPRCRSISPHRGLSCGNCCIEGRPVLRVLRRGQCMHLSKSSFQPRVRYRFSSGRCTILHVRPLRPYFLHNRLLSAKFSLSFVTLDRKETSAEDYALNFIGAQCSVSPGGSDSAAARNLHISHSPIFCLFASVEGLALLLTKPGQLHGVSVSAPISCSLSMQSLVCWEQGS
jgi:hypothetical protein